MSEHIDIFDHIQKQAAKQIREQRAKEGLPSPPPPVPIPYKREDGTIGESWAGEDLKQFVKSQEKWQQAFREPERGTKWE